MFLEFRRPAGPRGMSRSIDRFTVTASTDRVSLWTERRFRHRASASEP